MKSSSIERLTVFNFRFFFLNKYPIRLDPMTKKGASSAASSPSASAENGVAVGRFVCSLCAKIYRSGAGLRYHKRKRHRGKLKFAP